MLDHAFDLRLLVRLRQRVADERARRAERRFDEKLAVVVGEDRDAFGANGGEPAGMIEVRMRVDDVLDPLVREQTLRFGDDRQAARLALPALRARRRESLNSTASATYPPVMRYTPSASFSDATAGGGRSRRGATPRRGRRWRRRHELREVRRIRRARR